MRIQMSPHWRQKHILFFIIITCAVVLAGASMFVIYQVAMARIDHEQAASRATFATYDTTIAQLRAATTARLKAEHDAAVITAEQARVVTSATASQLTCHNGLASHNNPDTIDVLVNKSHCLSPIGFTPSDLVSIDGFLLSAKAAPHMNDMFAAASAAGLPLSLTSTYRSFDDQVATYSGWAQSNGSTQLADTVSARPGYSEHQTGLAADLKAGGCALECFATTPQYAWLQTHAADYGFVQRYYAGSETITGYSAEPWHYRYVGSDVAKDMKSKGIKTLEQYWHIDGGDYPR
jgi:zinc D-Ala-D-Ala carboxypeptidase